MLLDTSGLLSLLNREEPFHTQAREHYQVAPRRVTHNYVVAELVALAEARGILRQDNLAFARRIAVDPLIEFEWVDEPLHLEALHLLHARLDKSYSLCDAVSFVLMQRRGIREALTSDRHFEQEGFVRLLKEA